MCLMRTSGCWTVVVDSDVGTVLTDAVPLSVTHDSKALQLTAPSAREKSGKVARAADFIVKSKISEMERMERLMGG